MPLRRKMVSLAFSTVGGVGKTFSMVIALIRVEDEGVEVIWEAGSADNDNGCRVIKEYRC